MSSARKCWLATMRHTCVSAGGVGSYQRAEVSATGAGACSWATSRLWRRPWGWGPPAATSLTWCCAASLAPPRSRCSASEKWCSGRTPCMCSWPGRCCDHLLLLLVLLLLLLHACQIHSAGTPSTCANAVVQVVSAVEGLASHGFVNYFGLQRFGSGLSATHQCVPDLFCSKQHGSLTV